MNVAANGQVATPAGLAAFYAERLRKLADAIEAGTLVLVDFNTAWEVGEYEADAWIERQPTGDCTYTLTLRDPVAARRWAVVCAEHPEAAIMPADKWERSADE